MELFLSLHALSSSRLQCFGELLDLAMLRLEKLVGLGNERVGLVKLRLLLTSLRFRGGDVAFVTRDQFLELLRALPVEIDPVAERGQFTLHALHFRARVADLAVDLIQAAAFLRELVFARLDFLVRATFRFH